MTVQINYKANIPKKTSSNIVLFVDEKFNISGLKKYFLNSEFSYISDLLKNSDLKKDLLVFEISSKKTIFLASIKKDLKISDEVAITMGYPTIETFVAMNFGEGAEVDQVFDMAASCVESISDANQVYDCSTVPKKELIEFFDQMNSKQFMMIQEFFEKMPKLSHTVKVTNPNTGVESDVVLEGLASFFE